MTDARRQIVRLTHAGHAAFAELDTLQADAIDRLVGPLDDDQRLQLVTAMGRIRRVLDDQHPAYGLVLRAPGPGDLGWVVERHGARYAAEYGWDVDFEALVARIVADFGERGTPNPKPPGSPSWTANASAACSVRRRIPGHRATASAARRTAGARCRSRHATGGRMPSVRAAVRLCANHVVDQRCSG